MAEQKIKSGTKLQMAYDVPLGTEPNFNMICTYFKTLDDSAFLISIPMSGGQALPLDENQKFLIRFGTGANQTIVAGYADDIIRDGIRRYWKIRRVSQQRQYLQRIDERLKVALRITYIQDTWPMNSEGVIVPEEGLTLDISNGGIAFYLNHRFEIGEVTQVTLPRIGALADALEDVIGVVCWQREAPKGSPFRRIAGLQFRFADTADKEAYILYVNSVKKKYAL